MSNVRHRVIPELVVPGKRLGRHEEHDERSRAFAVTHTGPVKSVTWERHCAAYDQGDLGSCTGNAMAGALMTAPLFVPGRVLDESNAVAIYELATRVDRIPGHYPPDDTGSSGLAAARAAQRMGLIGAYHHAFGLTQALQALSRGPVIIGIDWHSGFDEPPNGELVITGEVRGGHEMVLDMLDIERGIVGGHNSWGDWGPLHGVYWMTLGTFGRLLKAGGDVVVPVADDEPRLAAIHELDEPTWSGAA